MPEIVLQHSVQRVFVGGSPFDRRLAEIQDACLVVPALVRRLIESIKKEAAMWGASKREAIDNELSEAGATHARAKQISEDKQAKHKAIEGQLASAPQGEWFVGSIMLVVTIVAIVAEYLLNRPLPLALAYKGWLAAAAMAGPAFILPLTLERVLSPLLAASSRFGRILRGVLLSAVAVLIISTVSLVGMIRAIVSAAYAGADVAPDQLKFVDTTMLVLGVCVCMCAVVASYTAGSQLGRAFRSRSLNSQLKSAATALEQAKEGEKQYEEDFLATRMEALEARLARIQTGTGVVNMVEWAEMIAVWGALGLGYRGTDSQFALVPAAVPATHELAVEAAA